MLLCSVCLRGFYCTLYWCLLIRFFVMMLYCGGCFIGNVCVFSAGFVLLLRFGVGCLS